MDIIELATSLQQSPENTEKLLFVDTDGKLTLLGAIAIVSLSLSVGKMIADCCIEYSRENASHLATRKPNA